LKETLHIHLLTLSHAIDELEAQLEAVISSIFFAKTNSIHPMIISPEQILKELLKTQVHLPKGVEYPIPLELQNVHNLLDVSQVRVYHANNKLIYKISVPLTGIVSFNLYSLLPLPTLTSNGFVSIHPKNKYLAFSDAKTQYSLLDNIDNCNLIAKRSFICPHNHMIYTSRSRVTCETELLTATTIPKSCLVQQTHEPLSVWHRLSTRNQWIFVLSDPVTMTLNCGQRVSDVKIKNVGILTLKPNCKGYSHDVILISEGINSSKVEALVPKIDISQDDCCNEQLINKSLNIPLLNPVHFSSSSLDDLHLISHKINSFSRDIDDLLDHSTKSNRFSIFQWIMLFILSVLIIFISLKCYYKCHAKRRMLAIEAPGTGNEGRINNIFHICFKNQTDSNNDSFELECTTSTSSERTHNAAEPQNNPIRRSQRLVNPQRSTPE
jgi:hypothetical protein